jgi:ABC-type glycerol-3-phosphate transport system permease component
MCACVVLIPIPIRLGVLCQRLDPWVKRFIIGVLSIKRTPFVALESDNLLSVKNAKNVETRKRLPIDSPLSVTLGTICGVACASMLSTYHLSPMRVRKERDFCCIFLLVLMYTHLVSSIWTHLPTYALVCSDTSWSSTSSAMNLYMILYCHDLSYVCICVCKYACCVFMRANRAKRC